MYSASEQFLLDVIKTLNLEPDDIRARNLPRLLQHIADIRDRAAGIERPPVPADHEEVRVLRLIEFVGPRALVEEQVKNSIHGSREGIRRLMGADYHDVKYKPVIVTGVTLHEFPEMLNAARGQVDMRPLRKMGEPSPEEARVRKLELALEAITTIDATTRERNAGIPDEKRASNIDVAMAIAREALQ